MPQTDLKVFQLHEIVCAQSTRGIDIMTKVNSSPGRHTFQLEGAKKRAEEEWLQLASTNPTLQDAVDTLKKAQEQVKILAALVNT
jgi:hypothetical protein